MAAANMAAKISNSVSQFWKEEGHTGNAAAAAAAAFTSHPESV